jgi:lipoprotein-anchoring transpeptidase ErfK/SrfK
MRHAARSWLAAAAVAVTGAAILGQSVAATAGPARPERAAVPVQHAVAARSAYVPGHRVLYLGTHGPDVRALQRRLNFLHYYAGPANGIFGPDTLEAVWAFKEVQAGRVVPVNPNSMSVRNQRWLLNPKLPPVLVPHGGSQLRIEVNKKLEVLVFYRSNKVALISHVSTGGGYYFCTPHGGGCGYAVTPDGNYRVLSFLSGWVKVPLGTMYNPVFFIGRSYAIHGDVPVPLTPVSHGCVRIPMHIAAFFHGMVHYGAGAGTPVYIRGPRV